MAKAIHSMIRVLDEARSVDFYSRAFGLSVADRLDFEGFTLVYLSNPETSFELELTINKGRTEPYVLGDGYGHPYWRMAAASMAPLVDVPAGARLWYDASQVSFLREDHKDLAEVQARQAEAIRQLVDGGFEAESVVTAVTTGDMTLLSHSGMTSVQLHAPGSESAATN